MNEVDKIGVDTNGKEEDMKKASNNFWLNLKIKENMIIQRSRMKWLNDGDVNNRFFHSVMKGRSRHNHIGPLYSKRGVLNSIKKVKREIFEHFGNKFKENESLRPILEGDAFKRLSQEERISLEVLF